MNKELIIVAAFLIGLILATNLNAQQREVYRSRSNVYQGSSSTQNRSSGKSVTVYRDKSNSLIGTAYTSGNRTVYKDRSNVTIGSSTASKNGFNPSSAAGRVYGLPTKTQK